LVTLIAVIIAAFFSISGERDKAVLARDDADIHRMAAEAINLAATSPTEALRMAVSATENAAKRFGTPTPRVQVALTTVLEASRQRAVFDPGLTTIEGFAVGGYGRLAAVAGDQGRVVLIDLANGERTSIAAHDGTTVAQIAVSDEGPIIATAGKDGTIKRWSVKGELVGEPQKLKLGWATALAIDPAGTLVASGEGDRMLHLRDASGTEVWPPRPGHANPIAAITFSDDGKLIAMHGPGNCRFVAKIMDCGWRKRANRASRGGRTHLCLCQGPLDDHSRDGAAAGNEIRTRGFSAAPYLPQTDYKVPIRSLSISRRGNRMALVTSSGDLHVLETWDLYEVNVGNVTAAKVKDASFGADDRTLLTLGEDSLIRVWDLASFEAMPEMGAPGGIVNSISWASDKSTVIYATENGASRATMHPITSATFRVSGMCGACITLRILKARNCGSQATPRNFAAFTGRRAIG
jgi:hypothetical protein